MLQSAFEHNFSEEINFADAIDLAGSDILAGIPDWIYVEGLYLEKNLTCCLLEWEWLTSKADQEDAFMFAQHIMDWEQSNQDIALESNALLEFLTHLPEADQAVIFKGLSQHKDTPSWQNSLKNPHSEWHAFYLHCFNWEAMFKAFAETPVSKRVRQALFTSWRDYIIQRAKPSTWRESWYHTTEPHDPWWLHWLIDSIEDDQKGPAWFQQQLAAWLTQLPGNKQALGEDYGFLRLLTKDLSEIDNRRQDQYPQFYAVVIRPDELRSPDQASRQAYLKQSASDNLMDQVMGYWKASLFCRNKNSNGCRYFDGRKSTQRLHLWRLCSIFEN